MRKCPTPWKRTFADKKQAKFYNFGDMRPYRCGCGGWHLTHKTREQYLRAKEEYFAVGR